MFGGKTVVVTAIRRKNDAIEFFHEEKKTHPLSSKLKKIPFLRGIIGLLEASAVGSKHLNFSTEQYETDSTEQSKKKEPPNHLATIVSVAVIGILSLLFGKLIFTVVPAILADFFFKSWVTGNIAQNLTEGIIKIVLLLTYLFFISHAPLIKRLFQYHGAEHKVINAYESGVELTVENVQRFSTLHYRCGSSFIIFSVIVGVVIYSLFHYNTLWQRIYQRIFLLPIVLGASYEVLQVTNKFRNVPFLKLLGLPGLWLQKLTTKEPTNKQVEVAIASFKKMQELDQGIVESQQIII